MIYIFSNICRLYMAFKMSGLYRQNRDGSVATYCLHVLLVHLCCPCCAQATAPCPVRECRATTLPARVAVQRGHMACPSSTTTYLLLHTTFKSSRQRPTSARRLQILVVARTTSASSHLGNLKTTSGSSPPSKRPNPISIVCDIINGNCPYGEHFIKILVFILQEKMGTLYHIAQAKRHNSASFKI